MKTTAQDTTQSTVGWFALTTGTVGIAKGQTLRLSVVNVGAVDARVLCGIWQNPHPLALLQDAHSLPSGHGKECDLKASEISKEHIDETGRVQVRAVVRSSVRTIRANLEVFDDQTGRTSIILCLQETPAPPPQ